jgi:hypothetical protein
MHATLSHTPALHASTAGHSCCCVSSLSWDTVARLSRINESPRPLNNPREELAPKALKKKKHPHRWLQPLLRLETDAADADLQRLRPGWHAQLQERHRRLLHLEEQVCRTVQERPPQAQAHHPQPCSTAGRVPRRSSAARVLGKALMSSDSQNSAVLGRVLWVRKHINPQILQKKITPYLASPPAKGGFACVRDRQTYMGHDAGCQPTGWVSVTAVAPRDGWHTMSGNARLSVYG